MRDRGDGAGWSQGRRDILLYKYKSFRNISHITELLCAQQLHCSYLNELNDPWEGTFVHTYRENVYTNGVTTTRQRTETRSIYDYPQLDKYRVCCLTSDYRNRLLWSYYADSFRGLCIEIDFDESLVAKRGKALEKINRVTYNGFLFYHNSEMTEHFEIENKPPTTKTILSLVSNKSKEWKHEREYRLITLNQKFSVQGRITRVFVGERADGLTKMAVKKLAGAVPVVVLRLRNDWEDRKARTMWNEEPV